MQKGWPYGRALWQGQIEGPEAAAAAEPYKPLQSPWQDSSSLCSKRRNYQLAAYKHFSSLLQQPEKEPDEQQALSRSFSRNSPNLF